jgi:hypothetical protein
VNLVAAREHTTDLTLSELTRIVHMQVLRGHLEVRDVELARTA